MGVGARGNGCNMTRQAKLSDSDLRLLALLKQDSRRSVSELASLLKVSRQTVQKRLSRLVDSGVIRRFTIETHDVGPGDSERAQVVFTLNVRQGTCAKIYAAIRRWPELQKCWSITGDRDMMVTVEIVAPQDAERIRAWFSRHPDVDAVQTAHILRMWKD
jgi:Lrp/AsnC family leucine-responsive transcriptional regulator